MPVNFDDSNTQAAARPHSIARRALLGLAILGVTTAGAASLLYGSIEPGDAFAVDPDAAQRRALLAPVTAWVRSAEFVAGDLRDGPSVAMVVFDGAAVAEAKLSAAQKLVDTLQMRSDEQRRPVLAAVRIGAGAITDALAPAAAQIDAALARGLDGIFLDCAAPLQQPGGAGEALIKTIGDTISRARQVNPNFLVIMDNSSELASDPRILRLIDGAAKDHLLFGIDGAAKANSHTDVIVGLHDLNRVKRSGRPVFVTEYLPADALAARTGARQMLATLGFVGRFVAPKGTL